MTTFIWDLDGTLIDSYPVFLTALSETFSYYQLPFDDKKIYSFIKSRSVNELLERQTVDFELLKTMFTEKSTARNIEIGLMQGAEKVLAWAQTQGIQNFIYTHKGKNAERLLNQLGISNYFTEVLTSENGFPRKPDPAAIRYLIKKYALNPDQTYYIGDRPLDIKVAHRSGIQSINFIKSENSQHINTLTNMIMLFSKKENYLDLEEL